MEIFILICLLLLIIVLVKNVIDPALAFFGLLTFYFCLGFISVSDFLGSFVNKSIIILTLLIIIADVISRTEITTIINKVLGERKRNLFRTGILVGFLSSFLSNTFVVQLFIKMLENKSYKSKMLLPICYLAILGGTVTSIGTSTNIIANGFLIEAGLPQFNFFDFSYVGIPLVFLGLIYLTLFTHKILKVKDEKTEEDDYKYFLEARVVEGSSLHGKTIIENKLRNLDSLFLVQIIRNSNIISPVTPNEIILENDILVFAGEISNIKELKKFDKLELFEQEHDILNKNLVWGIVSHNSDLLNKKINECNFRKKFDAAIVAIKRQGERMHGKIGEIKLCAGDQLILAIGDSFDPSLKEIKNNFYILSDIENTEKIDLKNTAIIFITFFSVIVLSALGIFDFIKALLVLLFLYMILGFITFKKALNNINIRLIILLGSALGISKVLVTNGVSDFLSSSILGFTHHVGVYGTLIVVYIFTVILTELTMHASAVAIAFPVAYLAATKLGVNPLTFVMTVTYGASASFLTKFYQANMLVASAGNYKPKDFLRLGLPLSIIYGIVVLLLVPVVFKF